MIFDNAGVPEGVSVDLNDFIDTGLLGTEQSFAIPLSEFNAENSVVDGFTITLTRTGGTKPTMAFDDLQIEQTGDPVVFKATTPIGTRFHITELRLALADNETGIVTVAGDTENHSMINLSFDKILSISRLTNGIIFKRVQAGKTLFSVTIRQLGDFLATGSNIVNVVSDGTNTFITLLVVFPEPIVLDGTPTDDFLSFTINDNLSSLLLFTAAARGAVEI